jgi:arylsulfatase A-like enzyme
VALSFFQNKTNEYDSGKIANPVWELLTSTITAEKKPKLFSMSIPEQTKKFIENYHTSKIESKLDSGGIINNIILFVLESTPKHFISLYDSTYHVTPNLAKWRNISTVFTNAYSHIPSTSNSMATMISSLYPLISYKSIINEYGKTSLPSLSTDMKNSGWQMSFFSSADLSFGNMSDYAKQYDFITVDDSKSISCVYNRFTVTNTMLDGLDDKCITNRYFQWYDSISSVKKFSLFWTNQTHYPYFINANNEIKYVTGNAELNRYLNGLKSSDEAFGMLMDGLQKRNILKNSLVIVVADHGEAFSTHGQSGHGSKIYEENINVPCIFYNPWLCKGKTIETITGLIDIAPTIAHILGSLGSKNWEGRSMLSPRENSRSFFLCPYSDFLLGTRNGDWKYIFNATLNKDELYNLKDDPGELNNLASKNQDIVKQEYEMLGAWVQFHNKKLKDLKDKQ